jgi:hypothetical protein
MKNWLVKHVGKSWKTTIISYAMAVILAVQPLLTEVIDWDSQRELIQYCARIVFAIAVAVFGKMAADSGQVKAIDKKVDDHLNE